jgi:hypothetical protein
MVQVMLVWPTGCTCALSLQQCRCVATVTSNLKGSQCCIGLRAPPPGSPARLWTPCRLYCWIAWSQQPTGPFNKSFPSAARTCTTLQRAKSKLVLEHVVVRRLKRKAGAGGKADGQAEGALDKRELQARCWAMSLAGRHMAWFSCLPPQQRPLII